ncbi:MAG TPA: hypothetical protein PK358_08685 [Spirochaetota bacterium]|nr:hypothetical protein [Spirochaetota bacterium]HPJ34894.1 hypothetical protein [Spirochaetota bacterium]
MHRIGRLLPSRSAVAPLLFLMLLTIPVFIREGHGEEYSTTIFGETVKDIVNYSEDEPSLLVRGRLTEEIDEIFMFNFSALHDISNEREEYTWNILTEGLNQHFDFTAGHFNLRFGSGLVMGKKKFMSADPFTRSLAVSGENSVIPATGTNPAGTFFGTALKIHSSGEENSIGLIPFYSSQRRYITVEEESQEYINASLATLSERTTRDSKYSEGTDIICCGGMSWFNWRNFFTLQLYGFSTELKDCDGDSLKWEYDSGKETGTHRYSSAGLFLEYADDTVSVFIEPAVSRRYSSEKISGKAIVWGCGVRNRDLILSIKGKTCDREYRSEYSSGDRNPENVFEIKTGFCTDRKLEFGASLYSEKNLNPSYARDYTDGTVREEVYTELRPIKPIDLTFTAARVRHYCDDMESEKLKFSPAIILKLPVNIIFRIKSDIQQEGSSKGYISACELKYLFFQNFTFSAGYTEIRIKGDTNIYAAIIPAAEAELCTSLYRESARGGAVKLKYRREDLSFHGRFSIAETCGEREMSAESSLGFVF